MPTSDPEKQRPQISISVMLLLTCIFAMMSAGIYYASRVGAIRDELALVSGGDASRPPGSSRTAHLAFLMFTYTSPLLLAALLGAIAGWLKFRRRRAETVVRRQQRDDDQRHKGERDGDDPGLAQRRPGLFGRQPIDPGKRIGTQQNPAE